MESFETDNQSQKKGIQFRCPQCMKLYQAYPDEIHSVQPEFKCVKCHCRFTFNYYPGVTEVKTKAFVLPQVDQLSRMRKKKNAAPTAELIQCPQCQTMNPRTSSDCFKCGVNIEKYEMIAKEKKVKALPSLMKLWHELLNDYTNMTKHMQFVDQCADLQALPFALKKYKDLKETQPHDPLANKMFDSVIMKTLSAQATKYKEATLLKKLSSLPWGNIFRTSPLVLSVLMMLFGMFGSVPNLVGAGVALMVLTCGFAYISFGRIQFSDFWKSETNS